MPVTRPNHRELWVSLLAVAVLAAMGFFVLSRVVLSIAHSAALTSFPTDPQF